MTARQALRSATAEDHDRVDALFSAFDLASPAGYRAFLTAQADPFLATEAELEQAGIARLVPDWQERKRGHLLRMDLSDLHCHSREGGGPEDVGSSHEDRLDSRLRGNDDRKCDAALLGALYVLEGSRLGGKLLRRHVPAGLPSRFLSAPARPGAWADLLEMLDNILYDAARIEAATEGARTIFRRFERGAERVLEIKAA